MKWKFSVAKSDSLRPDVLQHARLPCPSLPPRHLRGNHLRKLKMLHLLVEENASVCSEDFAVVQAYCGSKFTKNNSLIKQRK
ncbi:hypothetical protein CapIbe_003842 [Capra ibex]